MQAKEAVTPYVLTVKEAVTPYVLAARERVEPVVGPYYAQAKEASAKYAAMGEKWAKVVQCSVHGGRERV